MYGITLLGESSVYIRCNNNNDDYVHGLCRKLLRGYHISKIDGCKVAVAPICEENIDGFRELIRNFSFTVDPGVLYRVRKLLAGIRIRNLNPAAIETRLGGLYFKLRPFQRVGVLYGATHKRFFLCDDPGLGKSIQSLAIAEFISEWPCLIVATKSGVENWINEIKIHLPHRSFVKANDYTGEHVNFVIAKTGQLPALKDKMKSTPVISVFVDEVHKVKNHKTNGYKNIKLFTTDAYVIGLLSGTPIINRPSELISPLILLRKMHLFGSVKSFGEKYCNSKVSRFGTSYSGSSNLDDLFSRLRASSFIRRTKEDVLPELPAKITRFVYTDIENREQYDSLVNSGEELSGLAITSKLRMLTGHGKLTTAFQWIADFLKSDRKLVVFAWHTSVIDALVSKFQCLSMKGDHSELERQIAVNRFQNDPSEKLFVLNFQVGGTVHTLTSANDILILELPYTPAELIQAEDRLHRIGQLNSVTCYYMLGSRTIDIDLVKLLLYKRSIYTYQNLPNDKLTWGGNQGQLAA